MAKSADAFRTISEVADWLGVQTHVLRFWESKFAQVKPVKRAGGRRYYRPTDMLLLGGIRKLLHEDGLTIKGVQKILREEGMAHVADMSPPLDSATDAQLDADLVGAIEEDVAQPPIEAEVVPFEKKEVADRAALDAAAPDQTSDVGTAGQALPSFMRAPTPSTDDVSPSTEDQSGLPFPPLEEDVPSAPANHSEPAPSDASPHPPQAVEEPDVAAAPAEAEPSTPDRETTGALPSFLSDYATQPAQPQDEAALSKPRIIDVPDDPHPSEMTVAPSVLSKATAAKQLTNAQRSMVRPLIAQLTALRDQMANSRRDPR